MLMIWVSVYRDLRMGNLLCAHYEKIPLLGTAVFRGDYLFFGDKHLFEGRMFE